MARYAALKNLHLERETFVGRVTFAMIACSALALLLAGRLLQLQVLQHGYYSTRSEENRMRLTVIPPVRGLVYDRNGALLAQNAPGFRLEVVREEVPDLESSLARAGQLQAPFQGFQPQGGRRAPLHGNAVAAHGPQGRQA